MATRKRNMCVNCCFIFVPTVCAYEIKRLYVTTIQQVYTVIRKLSGQVDSLLTICFSVYLFELRRLTASIWPKSISCPSKNINNSSIHLLYCSYIQPFYFICTNSRNKYKTYLIELLQIKIVLTYFQWLNFN
jgi:hypothetical protein